MQQPIDRRPFITPLLSVAAVAIHFLPPDAAAALQFDRAALAAGELWRLFTAHVTHFSPSHLAWDVGVLFALGWFCERKSRRQTAVALALSAAAISLAVWFALPTFQIYRGLSGLDCALFGLLATRQIQHRSTAAKLTGLLALVALVLKSGWETLSGATLFVSGREFVPVPLAHLMGAGCGVVAAMLSSRRSGISFQHYVS
jgi:rhomboid family GlyGly-CTERM serine protease